VATATGLTIVKRFNYRGDPNEEYSNSYWFTPTTPPADDTAWRALLDAVVLVEKTIYPASCQVIRAYGYNDDTGHKPGDEGAVAGAVYNVDLRVAPNTPVAGTLATGGIELAPGDAAVWERWKTNRRTSPGSKPIYIRKYFHPALGNGTDADLVATAQKNALNALGAKLDDGSLPGGRKITVAGRSDVILSHGCSNFMTTRTLKRRGRRP
jgi:hypothetical protein